MKRAPVEELSHAGTSRDESELIRQVREGNPRAFTELVGNYQKAVFKLAYGFFQDGDDAMEIVQETFIRVYQKFDRFSNDESPAAFRSWVYRMAYNLCIDFYRKYKRKRAPEQDVYDFYETGGKEPVRPEEAIDRLHFQQALKKSVMKMPKRQRMVFMLKHYSALKHHEIAETMNISVGTTKSLYHRAMKYLEKHLNPYGGATAGGFG